MASKAEKAAEIFNGYIGKAEPPGEWYVVDQEKINRFADATGDHQFIHIDPKRAAELSPYKVTIAHGLFTLSLLPFLQSSIKAPYGEAYAGMVMAVNYGFEKVRFMAPVKVNSRVRLQRQIAKVELKDANTVHVIHNCSIEIEGEKKPACAAEWIGRLIYG
jgi:acyl dehydratase